jgi:fructose-specific phosphotransferase system IIC component
MNTIRDLAHYLLGFTFLYCISNATYTNDFWLWQKIIGSIFIGGIFGGVIGGFWEFINNVIFDIQADLNDVKRTAIAGILGCLTACFFTDITFITFWLFYACWALIVADLIRSTFKKYKG